MSSKELAELKAQIKAEVLEEMTQNKAYSAWHEVYGTDVNNIKNNFNNHKNNFKEGKHYFYLEGDELKVFKSQVNNIDLPINKFASHLYLWTERGANRHCKILDTDKAWEQFDNLEETYFRVKEHKETFQNLSPELRAIFTIDRKQQVLEGKINIIEDDVRTIRETATLTPAHVDMLNKKYRAYIVKMLGGKDSAAYKYHSLRSKIYSDFHREAMKQFGVCSYKSILVRDLDKFMKFIDNYEPEKYLIVAIDAYNNQFKMSV